MRARAPTPERVVFAREELKWVLGLIGRLPDRCKSVFRARRVLNARIEASRAFLLMDLGRDDEADAAIGRARRVMRDDLLLDRMQARLEIRRGRYEKAYQLLRRGDRYDALLWFDETTALRPLHCPHVDVRELETYPSGV